MPITWLYNLALFLSKRRYLGQSGSVWAWSQRCQCSHEQGRSGQLPPQTPPFLPPRTVQISQQLPKERPGPDPRAPRHTGAPVRAREGEPPPLGPLDRQRLTRSARSKGSQEKNKYVQRPLSHLKSRHPLPSRPHVPRISESLCRVTVMESSNGTVS